MRTLIIFSMLIYLKEASGSHAFGVSLQLWEEDCEIEMHTLYSLISPYFGLTSIFSQIPTEPPSISVLLGGFH